MSNAINANKLIHTKQGLEWLSQFERNLVAVFFPSFHGFGVGHFLYL